MNKSIVWYHADCLDGTCAAWVASHYLPRDTQFVPQQYSKALDISALDKHTDLYILDWCPENIADLDLISRMVRHVVLIDHHASAIQKLKAYGPIPNCEMFLAEENQWSGAMGTALWFAERLKQEPSYFEHWLVRAVDDRDRWQFKLPDTKAINEGLFHFGFDLQDWLDAAWTEEAKQGAITAGTVLMEKAEADAYQTIKAAGWTHPEGHYAICNCNYHMTSLIGNIMAEDTRVAVLWYVTSDNKVRVSLRSNANRPDAVNCSELATIIGGGGHRNAAGAVLPMEVGQAIGYIEAKLRRYLAF